jgi:hypothetical protein
MEYYITLILQLECLFKIVDVSTTCECEKSWASFINMRRRRISVKTKEKVANNSSSKCCCNGLFNKMHLFSVDRTQV